MESLCKLCATSHLCLQGPTDKYAYYIGKLYKKKLRVVDGAPNRAEDSKDLLMKGVMGHVLCECQGHWKSPYTDPKYGPHVRGDQKVLQILKLLAKIPKLIY